MLRICSEFPVQQPLLFSSTFGPVQLRATFSSTLGPSYFRAISLTSTDFRFSGNLANIDGLADLIFEGLGFHPMLGSDIGWCGRQAGSDIDWLGSDIEASSFNFWVLTSRQAKHGPNIEASSFHFWVRKFKAGSSSLTPEAQSRLRFGHLQFLGLGHSTAGSSSSLPIALNPGSSLAWLLWLEPTKQCRHFRLEPAKQCRQSSVGTLGLNPQSS